MNSPSFVHQKKKRCFFCTHTTPKARCTSNSIGRSPCHAHIIQKMGETVYKGAEMGFWEIKTLQSSLIGHQVKKVDFLWLAVDMVPPGGESDWYRTWTVKGTANLDRRIRFAKRAKFYWNWQLTNKLFRVRSEGEAVIQSEKRWRWPLENICQARVSNAPPS